MSILLAIESSCDETSAAVIANGKLLANIVATQEVHAQYGGVVPELASRAHQQNILPVVDQALSESKISKTDLNAIAFTRGPGLMGALLVGTSFAKGFAYALNIPLVEVNHMEAHILAHFIEEPKPLFPFLCLTVSGGHTQLVKVNSPLDMEVLGQTKDDAVGEAFDKIAKILGLPYPGGPELDALAKNGQADKFVFAKTEMPDLDFSFSGIKTSVLYFLQKEIKKNDKFIEENLSDLCASIQSALVEMLLKKLAKAVKETQIHQVAIAGGVAANSGLRDSLVGFGERYGCEIFIPKFEYCTDNAAMIAVAGHFKHEAGVHSNYNVIPDPRLKI